jgi:hypothetical protein
MHSSVDDTAIDDGLGETAPVWAVFGDLMSGVVGAFVLILIGVLLVQMDLVSSLQSEIAKRQQEEARRMALEKALAIPLQSGRVTLNNGRIGISGSVLFDFNSDQLRPEGQQLLKSLVPPLEVYLHRRQAHRQRPPPALRRQPGALGPARAHGDAHARQGRHAAPARVQRRLRRRATRGQQRR